MLTMKDDFKILTFVSFCKQCFLVFIRKRHQQNGQGAGNKQEYESPVPACHFGYIAENHIGKDGGSEEVPEVLTNKTGIYYDKTGRLSCCLSCD